MTVSLYPQLRKILLENGCRFVRQAKGSHEIWYSPLSGAKFSVAVTVKSRDTFDGILKEAGIKKLRKGGKPSQINT